MKRVAFITDQHICFATRWEETLRVMDWCAARLEQEQPDVIALGGDLFDRRPDVFELRVVAEWLVRLAAIAPVVGVAGNHDPVGLTVFNFLASKHPIHFADVPEVWHAAGVDLLLLPWPRKSHLLAQLGEAGKEEARQVGVDLLLNVLRGLGASGSSDGPRCFVGHVQLCGAKVSTGQPLAPGADFELGTQDLALARCDAYLLGHIHLPDDTMIGDSPVSYGGSFRRTAYGEVEEKSMVVVGFDGPVVTRERITIPCAPMLLCTAHWYTEHVGLPGDVVVPAGLCFDEDPAVLAGAEIRLRYSVDADQRDAAKAAAAEWKQRALEAGAIDCKVEEMVRSVNTARAPEIAKAATLDEKLAAYWKARGTTPSAERAGTLLSMAHELEQVA